MHIQISCFNRISTLLFAVFLMYCVLLTVHWRGSLYQNVGMIFLTKAFDSDTDWPHVEKPKYLPAAYALLLRATDLGSVSATRGLGIAQALLGDREGAVAAWRQTKDMVPVLLVWGKEANHIGRFKIAIAWYELAANIEKDNRDPWYYMGLAYAGHGDLDRALKFFSMGLGRSWGRETSVSDFYFQIGHTKRQRLNPPDFEGAREALSKAIEVDDFTRTSAKAEALYQLGSIAEYYGNNQKALEFYQQALRIDDAHYAATVSSARVYWKMGDVEQAVELYRAAIRLHPESAWAYLELAQLYQQVGELDLARLVFCRVRELDPDSVNKAIRAGWLNKEECRTK